MSKKYPYIDITVTEWPEGKATTVGSTDGAPQTVPPSIEDVASHFDGLTDGWLLWTTGDRRAYTVFSMSASGAVPTVAVTLLTDCDVLLAGRPVTALLTSIKSRVLDGDKISGDMFDRLIGEAGIPEEPLRCAGTDSFRIDGHGVCCRSYSSPGELTNIIGFPRQKSYTPYGCVAVVSASVPMVSGNELPHISAPVDKSLMVVCPEGVEASKQHVGFSDHLKVTYSCEGFDPVSVMFEVGTTNRYVRINGPALIVNSALHAGIVFRRRVPYTVTTSGGTPVDTYTILINGRTANRTEEGFEVANTDFENGEIQITVSSTNFSSYSHKFTPESLEAASPLEIVLEPESRNILLRLDFGDGRVVEEELNIEKNTPEYCQLRAGRFHGFRAHRLMGSTPETYNIDVRPTAVPRGQSVTADGTLPFDDEPSETQDAVQAAPAEQPAAEDRRPNVPVAPVMEKAPTAIHKEEKKERRAPQFANETLGETTEKPRRKLDMKKVATLALGAVVAIFAIWYIAGLFSGKGGSKGTAPADSAAMAAQQSLAGGSGSTAAQSVTADEQADIDYLNSNPVWNKSDLKTDKYKALIDAFVAGDVDAIASHEYFAVEGRATNNRANELMTNLWNSKGSSPGKKHPGILKKFNYSKGLDLYKLNNEVATKLPPAEEYNKTPRPKL